MAVFHAQTYALGNNVRQRTNFYTISWCHQKKRYKKHGMATWQPKQIYANSSSNIDSEIIEQAKSI